ncbi:MAG: NAD-dependent epimerase/dehydratase family protein, partial [Bacteroidetes bacterium]
MILVTGATGFLGRFVVDELLSNGRSVRVLVRDAANRTLPWGEGVEVIDGDILDVMALAQAMEGVEAVIHAAAMVSFQKKDRERVRQVNEEGTARVVDACLAAGVRRLVHVSSIGAVGRSPKGEAITEQTPWQPEQAQSTYAKSKRRAEMEVYRGIAEGLDAVMVNPGLILGPGDWTQGTPRIFATVAGGLRFRNHGTNGLVGAADVARACHLLLDAEVPAGERYILVAANQDYGQFLGSIAEALGKRPPRWVIPRPVAIA